MKRRLLLTVVILLSFLRLPLYAEQASVDIYYTASINGNLDGCECKGNPRAGLVKLSVFLREIDHADSLLIDLGDVLGAYEDRRLHDLILETCGELDYDVLVLADQDFTDGPEVLRERLKSYPYHSSNLSFNTSAGAEDEIAGQAIIERNGLKIALIPIIDPSVFRFQPEGIRKAVRIENPRAALQRVLNRPEIQAADARLLLYHGYRQNLDSLLREGDKVDAVLLAHEQMLIEDDSAAGVPVFSPGKDGNRVGILTIVFTDDGVRRIANSFRFFSYADEPDDPSVRRRIEIYNEEMRSALPIGN